MPIFDWKCLRHGGTSRLSHRGAITQRILGRVECIGGGYDWRNITVSNDADCCFKFVANGVTNRSTLGGKLYRTAIGQIGR